MSSRSAPAGTGVGSGPAQQISPPRLVGRDGELTRLTRAIASGPLLAIVEGEAGVGKTRLLDEALAAGSTGAPAPDVLRTTCPAVREPFPLGVVIDELRARFPDRASRLPPAPAPDEDAASVRHRQLRAVAELLADLPVEVLVLEDAHWADEATLELLAMLTARRPRPLGIVVSYRPEDVVPDSGLRRLSRAATGTSGLCLTLGALDLVGTAAMVSSMLGDEPISDEFAAFLHARTSGLPLAVEECVRAMGERGDLAIRDGVWVRRPLSEIGVPSAVRDLVLDRFGRLSPAGQAVMKAAAVLAAPADVETLAAVAGVSGARARAGANEAVASLLLSDVGWANLALRHALAGDAVCAAMPGPELRSAHARAGRALERSTPGALARLTRHARQAGDFARWARYAEQTADVATAAGDDVTADHHLLDLITSGRMTPADVARLAGKVRFARGDGAGGYTDLVEALSEVLARPDVDPQIAAELRCRLGNTLMMLYDYDAGLRHLEEAVPGLPADSPLLVWAMTLLGCPFGSAKPAAEHLYWIRAAETLDRQSSPEAHNLDGLRTLALLILGESSGWTKAAQVPTDEPAAARRLKVARNNLNIGHAAVLWGRFTEADRRLRASAALAARHDYRRTADAVRLVQTHLAWFTGDWDGLAPLAARLAADEDIAAPARLEADLVLARLGLAVGPVADAAARCRAVVEAARPIGQVNLWLEASAALARYLLEQGHPVDAAAILEEPVALIDSKGIWLWAAELAGVWIDVLAATDRLPEARRMVDAFDAGLAGRDAPVPQAALLGARAGLAQASGQTDGAIRWLARASSAWRAIPRPYDALLMRERRGECLLRVGRRDDGCAELAGSLDGFSRLGAGIDAQRVARRLREHGVPIRRPGAGRPSYGLDLSPRERDVVGLVAAGQTDREIAAALSLSPKTVACHVASARRKLAAPTRTALAVTAVGAGLVEPDRLLGSP